MILNPISSTSRLISELSIRGELQSVRDRFFALLIACTVILAVGVVLESAEDWLPSGRPILDINRGVFRPSRMIRWRRTLISLGWSLVIIGVIGEGIFEAGTSWADEALQNLNNTLLAITTEQAGSAAKSAKIAHGEAGDAKASAEDSENASKQAKDSARAASKLSLAAQVEARNARSDAADAKQQTLAATAELKEEREKRTELEKSLTPRSPFPIRYANRKPDLPNLTGFDDIKFDLVLIHDAEAERAAGAILALLNAAGWTRGNTTFVEYGTPETPQDGVSVSWFLAPRTYDTSIPETEEIVRSWMRCRAAGLGLIVYLLEHDWEAQESIDLKHNALNTVTIKIGFKPSPYFDPDPLKKLRKQFPSNLERNRDSLQYAQKDLREQGAHPWLWPREPPR